MSNNGGVGAWRNAGIITISLILLSLIGYRETVLYLLSVWNQLEIGEYGHGYLVLGISLYLIQRNLRESTGLVPVVSYWGLLAVCAGAFLWLISALAYVEMMQAVGLWFILMGIVWTGLGDQIGKRLLFPLFYIGFALPIWFPLSPFLQELSADVVFWVVRLLHIPAFRQDSLIVLPAGTLSIEEACSGLRYLLAALTLSTLYAYINYTKLQTRILIVLVAAVSAVFLNFVRVFIVVYLAYVTEMQHPLVHDHLMLGWYLFAAMMILLMFLDTKVIQHAAPKDSLEPTGDQDTIKAARPAKNPWYILIPAIVLIVSGPLLLQQTEVDADENNGGIAINAPAAQGGWAQVTDNQDDWMPVYHGAHSIRQVYEKGEERVFLYIGYYPAQRQGQELINDLNRIDDKKNWRSVHGKSKVPEDAQNQTLEQVIGKVGVRDRLVWYWYQVAGQSVTNKYLAKLLQVVGRLTGQPQASVFAVATEIDGLANARDRLDNFITVMKPSLVKITAEAD